MACEDIKHAPMGNLHILVRIAAMKPVTDPDHSCHVLGHIPPKDFALKLYCHHVFKVSVMCQIQGVSPPKERPPGIYFYFHFFIFLRNSRGLGH